MSLASAGEMLKKALSKSSALSTNPPCRARKPIRSLAACCLPRSQRASGTSVILSAAVPTMDSSAAIVETPPASAPRIAPTVATGASARPRVSWFHASSAGSAVVVYELKCAAIWRRVG